MAIGSLKNKVKSANLLKTGQNVTYIQNELLSFELEELPVEAPDFPLSVIEVECQSERIIDAHGTVWPR